jgi:NADH-quinone oxidoreductase subunit N
MASVLATFAGQAPVDGAPEIVTPEVDWPALMPLIALVVGAVLLITVTSLVKGGLVPAVPALFMVLAPAAAIVAVAWQGSDDGPWRVVAVAVAVVVWVAAAISARSARRHRAVIGYPAFFTIVVAGLSIVAALSLWQQVTDPAQGPFSTLNGSFGVDGFSVFITIVIAVAVILAALISDEYLRRAGEDGPELYVLLLLSAAGGVVMAGANDLIVLFVGLETLSIAAYVMAAMDRRRVESQEAGMKYFVLGAFSSAFFLYGIAFIYGATGSVNFIEIADYLAGTYLLENGLLLVGFALLLVGLGFKVAAVPFHTWVPDVYDGSPSPVVAFMASGIKAAGFAALIRVFVLTFGPFGGDWQPIVFALAVATLLVAAVLAVVQTDVKRMLAYSSINHAGFMLVGVQAATDRGTSAVLFYLAVYTFLVAGSFAVVTVIGRTGDRRHSIQEYTGLAKTRPALALAFTVLLLAQAGVPFTSGFFAKFEIIGAAVDARSFWLAVTAMVSAVIAAYLYLRLVVAMWMQDPAGVAVTDEDTIEVPWAVGVAIGAAVTVTLVIGVLPWIVLDWADKAVPVLTAATGG